MAHIDPHSAKIKELVDRAWNKTVLFCNQVIYHAHLYGFGLMRIPDPDVHKIHDVLTVAILPILEKLVEDADIDAEDGMKVANIRQYIKHLRDIVTAIDADDEAAFDAAVEALSREAMI